MNWLFKALPVFIVFVFVLIIALWISAIVGAVKTFNYVSKNGVKSVVEQIWNGGTSEKG
jgi:hypothetical protein